MTDIVNKFKECWDCILFDKEGFTVASFGKEIKPIVEAVEKQIPKGWIYLKEEERYLCPSCRSEVAWYYSYCRDCGQKLKG